MSPLRRLRAVALLLLPLVSACSDSAAPTEPAPTLPPIASWAGSYSGEARFGAANGTWGNGGTYRLVVTAEGSVLVAGNPLRSHTFDAGTRTLRWTIADGNPTNGEVVFHTTLTSDFFFRDQPNGTGGRGFTGYIQRPGEGRLDYRGLLLP